jgi:restriction endonuclease
MGWKKYEEQTAEFFRSLSCRVELGATIKGARAKHKIDVWVIFTRFGIETKWVVDCKFWRKPVTKEKVLVLISVVDDVGADRGILVSQRGFQAGAVRAAEHTNVTLTSLEELKQTAQNDLIVSALQTLEMRAIAVRYGLHELYSSELTGPGSITAKPLPGVDGKAVMNAIGRLSCLEFGFDRARLGTPPFPIEFDDTGNRQIATMTLEEFVARAATVIASAEATLQDNKPKTTV